MSHLESFHIRCLQRILGLTAFYTIHQSTSGVSMLYYLSTTEIDRPCSPDAKKNSSTKNTGRSESRIYKPRAGEILGRGIANQIPI